MFKSLEETLIYARYVEYKSMLALSNAKLLERSHPIYPRVLKDLRTPPDIPQGYVDEPTQPIYIPRICG